MGEIVVDFLYSRIELLNILSVLLDIKEGDPPDGDLEKSFNIIIGKRTVKLILKRLETCHDSLVHLLCRFLGLNPLVYSLLDEDSLKCSCMDLVFKMRPFHLQFSRKHILEMMGMIADHLRHRNDLRQAVNDHNRIDRNLRLALCISIKRINYIVCVGVPLKRDLNIRLVSGEVRHLCDVELSLLVCLHYGCDHLLRRHSVGKLCDHYLLRIGHIETGPDRDKAAAVLIT